MREVTFDGTPESFLSYSHLELVTPQNNPTPALIPEGLGLSPNGARVISFSFVSQSDEGILLVTVHEVHFVTCVPISQYQFFFKQDADLAVVLVGGEVQLRVISRDDSADRILSSTERIELGVQQYVLIELRLGSWCGGL